MKITDRILLLEKELNRLRLRGQFEARFRTMHTLTRMCVRCSRFRDPNDFTTIHTYGKDGSLRIRFHSWCNECRSKQKKQKRQEAFSQEMANKLSD